MPEGCQEIEQWMKWIQDLKSEFRKELEILKRSDDGIEKLNNPTRKHKRKLYR